MPEMEKMQKDEVKQREQGNGEKFLSFEELKTKYDALKELRRAVKIKGEEIVKILKELISSEKEWEAGDIKDTYKHDLFLASEAESVAIGCDEIEKLFSLYDSIINDINAKTENLLAKIRNDREKIKKTELLELSLELERRVKNDREESLQKQLIIFSKGVEGLAVVIQEILRKNSEEIDRITGLYIK